MIGEGHIGVWKELQGRGTKVVHPIFKEGCPLRADGKQSYLVAQLGQRAALVEHNSGDPTEIGKVEIGGNKYSHTAPPIPTLYPSAHMRTSSFMHLSGEWLTGMM